MGVSASIILLVRIRRDGYEYERHEYGLKPNSVSAKKVASVIYK